MVSFLRTLTKNLWGVVKLILRTEVNLVLRFSKTLSLAFIHLKIYACASFELNITEARGWADLCDNILWLVPSPHPSPGISAFVLPYWGDAAKIATREWDSQQSNSWWSTCWSSPKWKRGHSWGRASLEQYHTPLKYPQKRLKQGLHP